MGEVEMQDDITTGMDPLTVDKLKSFVNRIENLEEQKKEIGEDIKEVYAEAKSFGFDVKILRKCVALRKKRAEDRDAEEQILELYMKAIEEINRAATGGFMRATG